MGFTKYHHTKKDGRNLWLYSEGPKTYEFTNDMPPVETPSKPVKRFQPLRGEYVYYNPGRNQRTLDPPAEYNPLAPVAVDGFPGEIPVTDFEVAIFENRWPSLVDAPFNDQNTQLAYGRCEVVVYSTQSTGSLADLGTQRVAVLLRAVGDRVQEILKDSRINAVIPFENRGSFVGTSLPHPHGQIYAMGDISPTVKRQMDNARETQIFHHLFDKVDAEFQVAKSSHSLTFCPSFSRFPYETWVLPKRAVSNPAEMSDAEISDFALALSEQVRRFDRMFSEPMPYIMWHSFAQRGYEQDWPYHVQFWPLQRGEGKMKYLAGIEQISHSYMVDMLPEKAAADLRDAF